MVQAQTFSDLVPNAQLGHYTLIEHIADGGMGHVFRGFEPSLQRDVAIKVLKEEFTRDDTVLFQFEKEAQNIAALRHPNIVPVYYVGQQGELYFFVMPFISGDTLDVWSENGYRLSLEEGRWVMFQAVDALERAFQQNIIHLDIKPSNFLIDDNGAILLTDFGLAKVLGQNKDVEDEDCFGTPAYMCPEQILRKAVDQRSDIYSLGASMYHLISGDFLFLSDSITELVKAHLEKPFPYERAQEAGLPPGWIHILEKMTRKNPEDRYQNYAELREAIENIDQLVPVMDLGESSEEPTPTAVPVPLLQDSPKTLQGLLSPRLASWAQNPVDEGFHKPAKEIRESIKSTTGFRADIFVDAIKEMYHTSFDDIADLATAVSMVPEADAFLEELGSSELIAPDSQNTTRRKTLRSIGMTLSGQLLLTIITLKEFKKSEQEFTWLPYWQHAIATGIIAHTLRHLLEGNYVPGKGKKDIQGRRTITSAFRRNEVTRAEPMLLPGSLLHGVGKLILAELAPYPYFVALSLAQQNREFLDQTEERVFGLNHHEVGKHWASTRRLDTVVGQCAEHYNCLHNYVGVVPGLVGVSTYISRIFGIGYTGDPVIRQRDIWSTPVWAKLCEHCKTLSLTGEFMEREFIPLVGSLPLFKF